MSKTMSKAMSKKISKKRTLQLALSGVVATGLVGVATSAEAKPKWEGHEKCYGVAKKGMNDCGNAHHDCHGKAAADNAGDEWVYLPKGTCEKLAGGSAKPKKS